MRLMTLTAALAAAAGVAAPGAQAPAPPRTVATIDDFAHGAAGWTRVAHPRLRTRKVGGDYVLTIAAGGLTRSLPAGWAASFDLALSRGASARLELGGSGSLQLRSRRGRLVAGRAHTLAHTQAAGGWYRLEAATARAGAALDGQAVATSRGAARPRLAIQVGKGSVSVRALIASPANEPAGLLLQRLAFLHARVPPGNFPVGRGADGRLHFSRGWTRGFWPGALWQAFDMTHSRMFERWALAATLHNFGAEHADTHDLGFMYERSSVAAYDHLCTKGRHGRYCARLRRSSVTAAHSLEKLAATNPGLGTIPTSSKTLCNGCTSLGQADTIVDSVMNLPLLFWATSVTGDKRYRALAAHHARTVAARMVRADGSTWSSMHTRRKGGAFIKFHTHQGYRWNSTWSRGQAWAIYGFSYAANALDDRSLLATAAKTARYVMNRMPKPAVPLYDYDAPKGSPHDVSAAVISAAGMLRLAGACERMGATCDPSPQHARDYARGLLDAALARISRRPPLGLLSHQVLGLGGKSSWDDDAELIFGVDYALEALNGGA